MSSSTGGSPSIDAFTAQAHGAPATGSVHVERGEKVVLRWQISGQVEALTLGGEALDPGRTELEIHAEDCRILSLVASNGAGSVEAHLFVDVMDEGEAVSHHAIFHPQAPAEKRTPAQGADAATAGATETPETEAGSLHVEFEDALGGPLEGLYVIEHSDGKLEEGRLQRGVLHRDGLGPGEVKVHFPDLTEAQWSVDTLEVAETGALPTVELVLRHVALGSSHEATFSFLLEVDQEDGEAAGDEEAIHQVKRRLATDDGRLLDEQETRVAWALEGVERPEAGTTLAVVCRVEVEGLALTSPALRISGPTPAEPDA